MIRDPSDGTVREKPTGAKNAQVASGLPIDKLKDEELERLEKSRDWLKQRFNRRAEQTDSGLRSPTSGEG